jgi:hypothetical protein
MGGVSGRKGAMSSLGVETQPHTSSRLGAAPLIFSQGQGQHKFVHLWSVLICTKIRRWARDFKSIVLVVAYTKVLYFQYSICLTSCQLADDATCPQHLQILQCIQLFTVFCKYQSVL